MIQTKFAAERKTYGGPRYNQNTDTPYDTDAN